MAHHKYIEWFVRYKNSDQLNIMVKAVRLPFKRDAEVLGCRFKGGSLSWLYDGEDVQPYEEKSFEEALDYLAYKPKKDNINPSHYKQYSIESIDMMIAIWGKEKAAIYCEMTAFKYRMRLGHKDDMNQELKKEEWYINKAKELRNDTTTS